MSKKSGPPFVIYLYIKQGHAGKTVLEILQGTMEGILLLETIKENVRCSEDYISSCIDYACAVHLHHKRKKYIIIRPKNRSDVAPLDP